MAPAPIQQPELVIAESVEVPVGTAPVVDSYPEAFEEPVQQPIEMPPEVQPD